MNVAIIGMGPGHSSQLTLAARNMLHQSTVLFGHKRILEPVHKTGKKVFYTTNPEKIKAIIAQLPKNESVAVAVSGDVGFYSLAACLQEIPDCTVRRYAGISSLVYMAAAVSLSWQDAFVVSRHGRTQSLVHAVMTHRKVFCLTGGRQTPDALCRELCGAGLEYVQVYVGERLSYPEEQIISGTAETLQHQTFAPLNAMFILNDKAAPVYTPVHGLADELFIRGKVPMTKQEIRAVAIAKLQPQASDCIYDVGAGTGSCTVELARQAPLGHVYAFEINPDAVQLLQCNIEHFRTQHVTIVTGDAAETTGDKMLPAPQCAFVGGTKGKLGTVLDNLYAKNPSCRVVITAITIETLAAITTYYAEKKMYTLDVTQVTVASSKTIGSSHLMLGHNPVYVVTAGAVS